MKNARGFQHIQFLIQSKTPNNTSNKEHKQNIRFMQKKSDTRKQFTESQSIGLGDTIQKITKATGIEALVKFIGGEDCGCDARKNKLNKLFPYRKPLCMTEGEHDWFTHFKSVNNTTLSPMEADKIAVMWSRIFQSKRIQKPCTCNPKAWQNMINELTQVYDTYQVQE